MNAEKKMTDLVEEWVHDLRDHEKKMKQKFREIYEAEQKQHESRLQNLELIQCHPTENLLGTRPGGIRKKHQR